MEARNKRGEKHPRQPPRKLLCILWAWEDPLKVQAKFWGTGFLATHHRRHLSHSGSTCMYRFDFSSIQPLMTVVYPLLQLCYQCRLFANCLQKQRPAPLCLLYAPYLKSVFFGQELREYRSWGLLSRTLIDSRGASIYNRHICLVSGCTTRSHRASRLISSLWVEL